MSFQLSQFADREDLTSLIVYVAQPAESGPPDLIPIGHWPGGTPALATIGPDSPMRQPADQRRWLPLRHKDVLLGALQVECSVLPWPAPLSRRLQAVALCLTEALCLDLEQQRLQAELARQREQLELLLHQLRNPLAALRTFSQLLLRRLGPESPHRDLVEGLLAEQKQLNRFVDALDRLGESTPQLETTASPTPLLLPPLDRGGKTALEPMLEPLLGRAAATAALQGRPWQPPAGLPRWSGDAGAVAEIVANLLENAFRYSPAGCGLGLHCHSVELGDGGWALTVWDEGPEIAVAERDAIFTRGVRGSRGEALPGSGLGLALGRELARNLGGDLQLIIPPAAVDPCLPERGNAFRLMLPPGPPGP
ncbi:MAG: HAMP domain-containing sensor histidine kinase [Cyanobacteriota bacterium]|nr:HAMP domain-containing sensor histidine kinase [Cyanobacteriota bacterium]